MLESLHDLDRQLLQSLKPLEEALTLASEYIEGIGQVIASGNSAVEKFDIGKIQNVEAYDRLRSATDPIYLGKQLLKKIDPRIFNALARLLFPITFKDTGKPQADKAKQLKKIAKENQMSSTEEEAIRQYLLNEAKKDPSEFEADGFTVKSSLTDSQSATAMITNDTRVGINGGYFNMLGGLVTYGVPKVAKATGEFFFGDIVTMVHPDSTMKDRATAAMYTFYKPAKALSKLQLNKARKLVGTGNGSKPTSQTKTAEQVIADRTKGLDLNPHPIQQKQLSAKKMKELKAKIENRTITKAEYQRYTWNKKFAKHRNSGVSDFWYQERQRILNNETPTRNWNQEQLNDILKGKKPKVDGEIVQGHHSYSASQYPHLANKGEIIYPATPNEHFKGWHGGNWKNSLPGKPINPIEEIFKWPK